MQTKKQNNTETHVISADLIQSNISLAIKNWFRTGGNARYYCEPQTADEFKHALAYACAKKNSIFMLGHGANILISDAGYDGLVIHPKLTYIKQNNCDTDYTYITAGAGVGMHDLIEYCLNNKNIGLEEFSGIPGTVGGSVFINLHYFEFLLQHFITSATIIDKHTNQIEHVDTTWFNFGYNKSKLQERNHYLIDATFKLKNASDLEIAHARGRREEIIRHRTQRYPQSGTCGSFFRNFYDDEVSIISNGKKMIFVAYYLDKIGVKGQLRVGDAMVSYQHANMIVNCGNATTADILGVAQKMQELVQNQFGITPQPECLLVGFKEYPLLI